MNKLLLNERARNHIKIFPMADTVPGLPTDPGDRIRWCESRFKLLQHADNAERLFYVRHKGKGYQISVWELDGLYYLIECIRNEFKTFNTTIYITKDGDDAVNIAKFVQSNIDQIMKDYKEQILEARDALLKAKYEDTVDGDA